MKSLTLRQNFSWTFTGSLVYAVCQWGMLVVLAKLGSPEMVGQFTLGLAITAPVIMFTNLSLRGIQATDAKQQYRFSDYFGLRLLATGLALLIIALITVKAGYRWETSLVILLIGLAKAFEAISDVVHGLIQQHERMDRIATSQMVRGMLALLLLGLGLYLSRSLIWGVVGVVFADGLRLIIDIKTGASILHSISQLRPYWHWKNLRNLGWLSLPLGVVMLLVSLNTNIPRYLIEQHLGERELGIFGAISYLMVAGGMLVNALGESASPRLAKYYASGNREAFAWLLFKLVGIGVVLGALGILLAFAAGKSILTLLYSSEYAQRVEVFTGLMIAAGIKYIAHLLGYGMTASRYLRSQVPMFIAVTGTSAILSLWLVPKLGLQGAVISITISALLEVIIGLGVNLHALHKISDKFQKENELF